MSQVFAEACRQAFMICAAVTGYVSKAAEVALVANPKFNQQSHTLIFGEVFLKFSPVVVRSCLGLNQLIVPVQIFMSFLLSICPRRKAFGQPLVFTCD
jgi:hypothetical protein